MVNAEDSVADLNFYKWKTYKKVFYLQLLWRWTSAALFTVMIMCSLLDVGREGPMFDNHYWKFFIYITNWTLTIGVIQSWIAVVIVTRAFKSNNHDYDTVKMLENEKSVLGKIYWILYTCALVFSVFVGVGYWFFVYNPEIHIINAVNLFAHLFVFLIMAVDAIVLGHPIKMRDLMYTIPLDIIYAMFTLFYYLAGGLDRTMHYKIYPLLDWKQPLLMMLVLLVTATTVLIFHSIFYGVYRLRSYVIDKITKPKKITAIKNPDIENFN